MDLNMRGWLVLTGMMVILAILLDGYRRMRVAKKRANELHFGLEDIKGGDGFGSELPNGGARRLKRDEEEGVGTADHANPSVALARVEPVLSESLASKEGTGLAAHLTPSALDAAGHLEDTAAVPEPMPSVAQQSKATSATPAHETYTERLSQRPPPSEVIVINVIAKGEQAFHGKVLLQSVLSAGMRFGDRAIFHCYTQKQGTGKILFSMANGVEPGHFDLRSLEGITTPAISFFMSLPGPDQPIPAFLRMMETAKQVALDLGGELKDEQFSVITQQTIEHCRQRIQDYERRQLAHKVAN